MKRSITTLTVVLTLACAPILSWAAESKDHVCFKVLDADRDGMVTFTEFETVYGDDQATFDAADGDQDGKLSHDEYHRMLGHGAS